MSFKNVGIFDTDNAYFKSFGDLPNGTKYYDPWSKVDARKDLAIQMREAILKAVGTSSATIPVWLDSGLVDITARDTPVLALTPRVTNKGKSADYVRQTAAPAVDWLAESGTLTTADPTRAAASATVKFLYAVGEVTGPGIAAAAGSPVLAGMSAKELEVQTQYRALKIREESTLLKGNTSGDTDIYDVDAQGYIGLNATIITNTVNAAGAAISIAMFREAVRKGRLAGGRPNLAVTDWATYDGLRTVLTNYARYVNTTNLQFGITAMEVDGIPVVATTQMPSAASKKQMLVLDMNVIELRVLQDVSMEDLAKTTDTEKFMLKLYEVGICKAEEFCAKIYGLA